VNRAIAWFATNHVAANLLMMLLVVGGILSLFTIKQELMPEISLDIVTVSVVYPGATPVEIEEGICIRIEEELQGLQGVKHIRSTASEGICQVTVELLAGEDVRRRLGEIQSRVDGIDSFPEEAEKPVVLQSEVRFQVLDVAVSGDVDEATLKLLGQQVRDEIAALPGITDVELVATRPYEVAIEVSEDALLRHGLTFDDVVRAVRRSSLDLPGGSVKTAGGEILIRTKGQAYRGGEFEKLVLLSSPDGSRLRLGDVARVVDGFEESDQVARFDGRPTTLVEVYRVGDQSALEISATVRDYLERANQDLPAGVTLTIWQENARFLRARLDTLLRNGRDGFALVLLVLALFLRLRLAFWVSLGVPLSFLGTLFLMPSLDLSVNLISLMAFIVVLGIVVDDAIASGLQWVIREVYRPALEVLLEWRYLTVAAGVSILLIALATLGGGWLRFVFQPEVEGDVAVAYLTMPQGTPVDVTAEAVRQCRPGDAGPGLLVDPARGPPPHRQRHRRGGPPGGQRQRDRRRPQAGAGARDRGHSSPRADLLRRRAARAVGGAGKPDPGLDHRAGRDLRAAGGTAALLRAAPHHHDRDSLWAGGGRRRSPDHAVQVQHDVGGGAGGALRCRRERQPGAGRLHQPLPRQGRSAPGGDPRGRHRAFPRHSTHLSHHLRRALAAAAGGERAGPVPDSDGHLPCLRRDLRHPDQPGVGAGQLSDSRGSASRRRLAAPRERTG